MFSALDEDNIVALNAISPPDSTAVIQLFGDYHPEEKGKIIRDPYFDAHDDGFRSCFDECMKCLQNFLEKVEPEEAAYSLVTVNITT